jgi:hypothetical protein
MDQMCQALIGGKKFFGLFPEHPDKQMCYGGLGGIGEM